MRRAKQISSSEKRGGASPASEGGAGRAGPPGVRGAAAAVVPGAKHEQEPPSAAGCAAAGTRPRGTLTGGELERACILAMRPREARSGGTWPRRWPPCTAASPDGTSRRSRTSRRRMSERWMTARAASFFSSMVMRAVAALKAIDTRHSSRARHVLRGGAPAAPCPPPLFSCRCRLFSIERRMTARAASRRSSIVCIAAYRRPMLALRSSRRRCRLALAAAASARGRWASEPARRSRAARPRTTASHRGRPMPAPPTRSHAVSLAQSSSSARAAVVQALSLVRPERTLYPASLLSSSSSRSAASSSAFRCSSASANSSSLELCRASA